MRRTIFLVAAAAMAAVSGTACGSDDRSAGENGARVEVVAAFYPLAEAARQVGGDQVDVSDLTPTGAEPHDLELTPDQVDAIDEADVVVVMGHDFQPAIEDIAERRAGATVFVLDALPSATDGKLDPHVWLDPQLMQEIVAAVENALAEADPGNAATYAANSRDYRGLLRALDGEYASGLADCRRDEIVTAHDAFGWLARRYGLEQISIAGISPDQEPSPDRIAELADLAERDGVTTIFTETLVSPSLAETLAREAGGLETRTLNPLEGLTDDEAGAGAGYISVMRDNLEALRDALGCR